MVDVQSWTSLKPYKNQIGGHSGQILISEENDSKTVFKLFNECEKAFYKDCITRYPKLSFYFPRYFQTFICDNGLRLIEIENLAFQYKSPCICDIKIGKRLCDDFASPEKARRLYLKNVSSTSSSLGLRLVGMVIDTNGRRTRRTREDGYRLDTDGLYKELADFLPDRDLRLFFLNRIKFLIDALQNIPCRIYSSSLLMIYDASSLQKRDMRLIDFAHSRFASTELEKLGLDYNNPDLNLLSGLKELLHLLHTIYSTDNLIEKNKK